MRQLRFVVIALTTFLFVINAIFLRRTVAVVLCGILSFNSTSCYSFLTKAETANATVSPSKILEHSQSPQEAQNIYKYQAVNPLIASGKASSNTAPQYSFNLVARQGLVIGGQKVQDINTTIPWKQHRLIDENGRVVFQNNGTIFGDNQAIAFVGQTIGDYFIKEVKDYFLFKDGTLDILLRVGDASPSSYGHYIITRNSQILIDKSGDLFDVVPGYPDTYYVRSVTHNGYFLKNGVTEVSEMPKRKESSPPNLPGANPYGCISNDKNQNVCSGLNFGYLVRDGGKYLPSIGSPLAINNNGRVVTSLMQVLDYEKDALPSLQAALAKSGNSELEEIRARHRSDLSASDLSSPIYTNARIPYRVKIPYEKLFGTTFNSLTDKIRYLQLTDSGYMAIVLDEPVNHQIGSGVIIRATPSGSVGESNELQSLVLNRATTTDAQSVTVDYTIGTSDKGGANKPIHFEVYRSPVEDAAPATQKIGEQDISDPILLSSGKHSVKLISGTDLKPDTAFPYVVVLATYNGKKSTTYFRKWLLGAISHGFNRWNQGFWYYWFGKTVEFYTGDAFHPHDNVTGKPDWETNMAKNLKDYNRYDDVIEFDWTETCGKSEPPGLAKEFAKQAGIKLGRQVSDWISSHRKQHTGDVVDIHLIGHSRGTVVVTQSLSYLLPELRELHLGSYIELTLLDPHPANNDFGYLEENTKKTFSLGTNADNMMKNRDSLKESDTLLDALFKASDAFLKLEASEGFNNLQGIPIPTNEKARLTDKDIRFNIFVSLAEDLTIEFQKKVEDPYLKIPQGVKKIDVWYQKTKADLLGDAPDQEYIMNLWGLIDAIKNESGLPMQWHDLTAPGIGHNQVPDVYEKQVVETGRLNRSV